jgi:hypothetical protein
VRALGSWLVAGGLAAVALAATVDALRGEPRIETVGGRPAPAGRSEAPTLPHPIEGRPALAEELRAAGADGVLSLPDARCRRWPLRLPALEWTTDESLPAPGCGPGRRRSTVFDPAGDLTAVEIDGRTILVASGSWRYGFRGRRPAFKRDGTLTFLRGGALYAWSRRCPPGTPVVRFGTTRPAERCLRRLMSTRELERAFQAPRDVLDSYAFAEVVWLGDGRLAAIVVGSSLEHNVLAVLDRGRVEASFAAFGVRLSDLAASPGQNYLAARLGGSVVIFDNRLLLEALPPGEPFRALAWSPDERFAAAAAATSVHVFRPDRPTSGAIVLGVSARDVAWE